ncbi:MAG: 30S ribosomal protein S8 [Bacteroidota bacterium]
MTDPIANLLTCIRNAIHARHRVLEVSSSNMGESIIGVLHDKGYIQGYKVLDPKKGQKNIKISLKYNPETKQSAIVRLERVSKPSLRKYSKASDLPHVCNGLGIAVLSTSEGVMSDKEARKKNIGGEVLCYVF